AERGGVEPLHSRARNGRRRAAADRSADHELRIGGLNLEIPLRSRYEERAPCGELGGILEGVLAQHDLQRYPVGAGDAPERLAGAHVVHDSGLLNDLFLGPRRAVRAGARGDAQDERQSRTSPGSSQSFSSSTSSFRVRSKIGKHTSELQSLAY